MITENVGMAQEFTGTRLSTKRIATVMIASFGFYAIYWMYLTWKQLRSERDVQHFPVWHALGFLVPEYSLLITYQHARAIREVSLGAGLVPRVNAWVAAGLVASAGVSLGVQILLLAFGVLSGLSELATVLALDAIDMALMLVLELWMQRDLNDYWSVVNDNGSRHAPVGIGEMVTVLLGLFIWVNSTIKLVGLID